MKSGNRTRKHFGAPHGTLRRFLLMQALFLSLLPGIAEADPGRIYNPGDPAAPGGIAGNAGIPLTHALAVDHGRRNVYRGDLTDAETGFRFSHLPVGKYDLILIGKNRVLYEGLSLGEDTAPPPSSPPEKNLSVRIAAADSFFNRHIVERVGFEGNRAFALVERIRDGAILKQSGEKLSSNLRRMEIIELEKAADDWQMINTRHLIREEEPLKGGTEFFVHHRIAELGNIRVIDTVKPVGQFSLPK